MSEALKAPSFTNSPIESSRPPRANLEGKKTGLTVQKRNRVGLKIKIKEQRGSGCRAK